MSNAEHKSFSPTPLLAAALALLLLCGGAFWGALAPDASAASAAPSRGVEPAPDDALAKALREAASSAQDGIFEPEEPPLEGEGGEHLPPEPAPAPLPLPPKPVEIHPQDPAHGSPDLVGDTLKKADQLYAAKKVRDAVALIQPLAERGDGRAAFALGLMHARGDINGRPDFQKTRELWEIAAKDGHPEAEYNLGLLYQRGALGKRDIPAAAACWKRAAAAGHGGAMHMLGAMYRAGDGVPRDYAESLRWFNAAAKLGHPDAQYQLAVMYLNGTGVPRDNVRAREWMEEAASVGHPGAIQGLKIFKK